MFFEVPFVIALCIVALVIVFKINKIQHIESDDIPLPELAHNLLQELSEINFLPASVRKEAKDEWNGRFESYLERKKLGQPTSFYKKIKLRIIK